MISVTCIFLSFLRVKDLKYDFACFGCQQQNELLYLATFFSSVYLTIVGIVVTALQQ